jgi:hypothetical protein
MGFDSHVVRVRTVKGVEVPEERAQINPPLLLAHLCVYTYEKGQSMVLLYSQHQVFIQDVNVSLASRPFNINPIRPAHLPRVITPRPNTREIEVKRPGDAQGDEGEEAADADPDGQFAGDVEPPPCQVGEGQGEGEDEEGPWDRVGEAGVEGGEVVC